MVDISLSNSAGFPLDAEKCLTMVRQILHDYGVDRGEMSIAVVDDATIHEINREYLDHDYPTDVLSFLLDSHHDSWQGEVIVSAETARNVAQEEGWEAEAELFLYVVHGTLHLVGLDDHEAAACATMRAQERRYLNQWGFNSPKGAN